MKISIELFRLMLTGLVKTEFTDLVSEIVEVAQHLSSNERLQDDYNTVCDDLDKARQQLYNQAETISKQDLQIKRLNEQIDMYTQKLLSTKCYSILQYDEIGPVAVQTDKLKKIYDFLRQDKKIQAIKVLREETNMGLKDAKDMVEQLLSHLVPAAQEDNNGHLTGHALRIDLAKRWFRLPSVQANIGVVTGYVTEWYQYGHPENNVYRMQFKRQSVTEIGVDEEVFVMLQFDAQNRIVGATLHYGEGGAMDLPTKEVNHDTPERV